MIAFKPLDKNDFKLLYQWINFDFVARSYTYRENIYKDVEKKYSRGFQYAIPVDGYMVYIDQKKIGYAQCYKIHRYPKLLSCLEVSEGTAGMDLFIGDLDYVHKGHGRNIILEFLKEHVFANDDIRSCVVGIHPENNTAIRVYEKAGFRYLKTVQCNESTESEYIMIKHKSDETVVYSTASEEKLSTES